MKLKDSGGRQGTRMVRDGGETAPGESHAKNQEARGMASDFPKATRATK